jgi:ribosomal protein S18 acetylase RimI-like enzyme
VIRQLTTTDVAQFLQIRREALELEPTAFGSSPGEDFAQSDEPVQRLLADANTAVFGAFAPDLVGIVGVRRQTRRKTRHKADIWGMFVRREHRGRGLARLLMEAAISYARQQDGVRVLQLAVTEKAVTAAILYEKLGFVVWGVEPAGLHVDGADLFESHMFLKL